MKHGFHMKAIRPSAAFLLAWLSIGLTPAYAADATQQVPTYETPHGQSLGQAPIQPGSQQRQNNEGRTDDNSHMQSQESKDKQHEQESNTKTPDSTPSAY